MEHTAYGDIKTRTPYLDRASRFRGHEAVRILARVWSCRPSPSSSCLFLRPRIMIPSTPDIVPRRNSSQPPRLEWGFENPHPATSRSMEPWLQCNAKPTSLPPGSLSTRFMPCTRPACAYVRTYVSVLAEQAPTRELRRLETRLVDLPFPALLLAAGLSFLTTRARNKGKKADELPPPRHGFLATVGKGFICMHLGTLKPIKGVKLRVDHVDFSSLWESGCLEEDQGRGMVD